jgi:membrane protease YdiL (CAAX protease family)
VSYDSARNTLPSRRPRVVRATLPAMSYPPASRTDEPPGWIPPILECVLLLLVSLMAVRFVSSVVITLAAPAWHDSPAGTPPPAGLVVGGTLANELAVGAVLGAYLWLRRQHRPVLVPLAAPTARGLLGTFLVVLGAVPWADVMAVLVERWTGRRSDAVAIVNSAVRGAGVTGMIGLVVALALVPAMVEEALFRGVITAGFQRSRVEALLAPSLLFGAFHLEPQQAAATAVLGIAFGLGRLCTGTVLGAMGAHAAYNTGVLLLTRLVGPPAESRISWPIVAFGTVTFAVGCWLLAARRAPVR